jgi:hypothetical protein
MTSKMPQSFINLKKRLPDDVWQRALAAFDSWEASFFSLEMLIFLREKNGRKFYLLKIDEDYGAICHIKDDIAVWLWIDRHQTLPRILENAFEADF